MKTSTILLSSICAITLGVQILRDWGFKVAYQQQTSTSQAPLLPLPSGHIRAIMADSIQFEVCADSTKRGINLLERSDDLNAVIDFKMHGDTLWVKPKVAYNPKFTLYMPTVEVVMCRFSEVRYRSPKQNTLTAVSQNNGDVRIVGGQYNELNVVASGDGMVSTEKGVKINTLNLNLAGETTFSSYDVDCSIARLGKITASDKSTVTLTFNGKTISKLTKISTP